MKASLYSRSNVRLKFFNEDNKDYLIKRKLAVTYDQYRVETDSIKHYVTYEYVFTGIDNSVPQSEIIIFSKDLPVSYEKTTGIKGNKFSTEPKNDLGIEVKDLIVSLEKGEEKITRRPPEYPDPRIKEIETREQQITVKRKITFVNNTTEKIEDLEFILTETKDIRFKSSTPKPSEEDRPEYKWKINIDGEQSVSVEIELSFIKVKTFEIEKPVKGQQDLHDDFSQVQQQMISEEQAYFPENENPSL